MSNNNYRFSIVRRELEKYALVAFIDLLGTRNLYASTLAEEQADNALNVLLGEFDIKFSEHFSEKEIIKKNFDVSVFADSIVISERLRTPRIVARLVDFLLNYQEDLYLNRDLPSRAIITTCSFFSLKLTDVSDNSILSPRCNTSVSLCGGKGIIDADSNLKGLPMGVYVISSIEKRLSADQKMRAVPVQGEELLFIKKNTDIFRYLR